MPSTKSMIIGATIGAVLIAILVFSVALPSGLAGVVESMAWITEILLLAAPLIAIAFFIIFILEWFCLP